MANKARRSNLENHIRQEECLKSGIVMLPKLPIRKKSRNKQLKAARMLLKAKRYSSRRKPA